MRGHIALGAPGDLKEYMLVNPGSYSASLANPMAVKLGSGAGKYDDQMPWSYWLMDDWQSGIGQVDPSGGGYLFGDIDSRVPRQLILPPAIGATGLNAYNVLNRNLPLDQATLPVTTDDIETPKSWQVRTANPVGASDNISVYMKVPSGVGITVKVKDAAGATTLGAMTYTYNGRYAGVRWHNIPVYLAYSGWVAATTYTIELQCTTCTGGSSSGQTLLPLAGGVPFYMWTEYAITFAQVIRFGTNLYGYFEGSPQLYKFDSGTNTWATIGAARAAAIRHLTVWNGILWISLGIATNFDKMSTAEVFSAGNAPSNGFHHWNGYLYRFSGASIYYSADGTVWSGPFTADTSEEITGAQGMGNDIYFVNQNGMYRFAPGDIIYGVIRWGAPSSQYSLGAKFNSRIVNYQGDIFVAVSHEIIRYTAAGQVSNIWINGNGDLHPAYMGNASALTVMNNWLLASVNGVEDCIVLAWQRGGWHPLVRTPRISGNPHIPLYYDRALSRLWIGFSPWFFFARIPDYAQNPITDPQSRYMPYGRIETDWWYGDLLEVQKDIDSIYMSVPPPANGDPYWYIDVWWQDEGSTGWEKLGSVTPGIEQKRWANYTTRPNTRKFKLALEFNSPRLDLTPRVQAIRIRYHPMVADRWRWNLPIQLQDNQQMVDGELNSIALATQESNLRNLITQVQPVIFRDIDGTQYETKVLSVTRQIRDYEYLPHGLGAQFKSVYNVALEQIVAEVYA